MDNTIGQIEGVLVLSIARIEYNVALYLSHFSVNVTPTAMSVSGFLGQAEKEARAIINRCT